MALTYLARLSNRGAFALWLILTAVVLGLFSTAYANYEANKAREAEESITAPENEESDEADKSREFAISWTGTGEALTGAFALERGRWEYCATIEGATIPPARDPRNDGGELPPSGPGLQVSLFSAEGIWLDSVSGQGGSGSIGCRPLEGPGEYEFRLIQLDPWDVDWTLRVQEAQRGPAAIELGLQRWTDYVDHKMPEIGADGSLRFEGLRGMFTAFFVPLGDTWTMCWELYTTSAVPNVVSSSTYFEIGLNIENERGERGVWGLWEDSSPGESAECVDVQNTQPVARHWLYISEGSHERGWRLSIEGVELIE